MTLAPSITDAHEITAVMLCAQAGVTRATLTRHINAQLIERGELRAGTGRVFWTRTQANKWLRRIGKCNSQFPKP